MVVTQLLTPYRRFITITWKRRQSDRAGGCLSTVFYNYHLSFFVSLARLFFFSLLYFLLSTFSSHLLIYLLTWIHFLGWELIGFQDNRIGSQSRQIYARNKRLFHFQDPAGVHKHLILQAWGGPWFSTTYMGRSLTMASNLASLEMAARAVSGQTAGWSIWTSGQGTA